jgi:hypothetical protein
VIVAFPSRVDTYPNVGTSIIYGDGTASPIYHQYVYYSLWVYSAKGWVGMDPSRPDDLKRFEDLNQIWNVQMWDRQLNWWVWAMTGNEVLGPYVDLSIPGDDLAIPAADVGMHVQAGNRTWKVAVETYWGPLFTDANAPSLRDGSLPTNGSYTFDYATVTCQS